MQREQSWVLLSVMECGAQRTGGTCFAYRRSGFDSKHQHLLFLPVPGRIPEWGVAP